MQVRLSFKRVYCNACSSCSSCAITVHRLAKLHICASRAGYAEPHMSVGRSPMPPPQAHQAQPGAVWTALILICATLTALAGAFTAFVMYMRPVLKVCCMSHLHCSEFSTGSMKDCLGCIAHSKVVTNVLVTHAASLLQKAA